MLEIYAVKQEKQILTVRDLCPDKPSFSLLVPGTLN